MDDIYGEALWDYANQEEEGTLLLHNSYGEPEEMPLWYFFREYEDMPERERMALSVCEGKVLDVGAGTGSHSLILQHAGVEVTAIDTSEKAVALMKESGLKSVRQVDFFEYKSEPYDTILCLMNGIGIIGKLNRLEAFLNQAKSLLRPGGQLLFDSSDIRYLYEDAALPAHYFGEVHFQYEYKSKKGDWFEWVYIDPDTLCDQAEALGWHTYFLHSDENDQYLVRMIPK